jgi:calcium/proton exchanger cax
VKNWSALSGHRRGARLSTAFSARAAGQRRRRREGMSAVTMAMKGRFDLSLGISLGSCILIALFVSPVLVFSYFIGPQPFQLFQHGGVGLLFLSVLIGAMVAT